jgi:regulator of sirC expression with transglutaminase-like and TPR domain
MKGDSVLVNMIGMDDWQFSEEISKPAINVPRAALSFARSLAYPRLDIENYLSRLDRLADEARPLIPSAAPLPERVDALSYFLFEQKNYRGARGTNDSTIFDYTHPDHNFLNKVIDNRLGIPISLSVVYIAVARRVGLAAYGIGLPGHFITGVYEAGTEVLVDPFNSGLRISIADCRRLVRESTGFQRPFNPKWLTPISPTNLLARMLTNLCHIYIQKQDWSSAIPVIKHLLMVQPETDFHLRDLGYLYMYDGSLRLSAQYLEEYLRRVPDAPDFETVRSSLTIVAGRLALWN